MRELVSFEKQGAIAQLCINHPPVNSLSQPVRQGLSDALQQIAEDPGIKAVVLLSSGRLFSAGADISEFGKSPREPFLPDLLAQIDGFKKPIVAAIRGKALGGGLELALSCHYRVAEVATQLGFPEVNLGLIPGAGGTQLLPRLVGVERALEIITKGSPLPAAEAANLGMLDKVADADLAMAANDFANFVISEGKPILRTSRREIISKGLAEDFFETARQQLMQTYKGQAAPLAALDALENATKMNFDQGCAAERKMFLELLASDQSKALRYSFFAERNAGKIDRQLKQTPPLINSVGIVGAGTMGTGIAINFLSVGMPVTLLELAPEALDRGVASIESYYQARVDRGRLPKAKADQCLANLKPVLEYQDLQDVDLVIEAVFEDMKVKQEVFKNFDQFAKPDAVLATNTSTLDVDQIAAITKRPHQVLGLHFFSPAQVMRLLEVVRGKETSPEVLQSAMDLAARIRKVAVISGVCDGFIGNRMLKGYRREASALLLEGATPEQVDGAARDFGMAMGPLAVGDLAGLDISYSSRQQRRERGEYVDPIEGAVADRLVQLGRKGQKTGAGYYRYEEGSRKPIPDPQVQSLIEEVAREFSVVRRKILADEMQLRLILPLINEGAKILSEKIAQRASDIDLVWVHGYGFPKTRGGPMRYADGLGLDKVLERLEYYQSIYGEFWRPAALIRNLVNEGSFFTSQNHTGEDPEPWLAVAKV